MTTIKQLCFVLAICAAGTGSTFAQEAPAGYRSLDTMDQPAAKQVIVEAPKAEAPAQQEFTVVRGDSLRATLERWSKQAGWQEIAWKLPEDSDFTLGANATFNADLVTATRAFVRALGIEAELRVRFSQGNKLMIVEPLK